MKLAYVTATDRVSPSERRYMSSVFDGVRDAADIDAEMVIVPAVLDTQSRKTPPIAELRAAHASLMERLAAEAPDTIVTLGIAALNALTVPTPAATMKR